jgi:hypothetical protein
VAPHNRKAGDRRLKDMSADAALEHDADGPPSDEIEYEQTFPIGENVAYVQRFVMDDRDRIKRWAVVQIRRVQGSWHRVAVYDTCHEKGIHVHFYDKEDVEFAETHLRSVDSNADLVEGLDYAVVRVVEAWRENERRSERGY